MSNSNIRLCPTLIPSILALLFSAGCTRIQTVEEYHGAEPLPKPRIALVKNFAYSPEGINLNSGLFAKIERRFEYADSTEQQLLLGKTVSEALANKLVTKLQDLGLDARRFDDDTTPEGDYLLIEGQLTSIDQGNRAERMVLGLGFGKSLVKTWCQVYDISESGQKLAEEFDTEAHSSYKPGAAETMGVGAVAGHVTTAAAVSVAGGVAGETLGSTVQEDAKRTASDLVEKMKPFFVAQNWIEAK